MHLKTNISGSAENMSKMKSPKSSIYEAKLKEGTL